METKRVLHILYNCWQEGFVDTQKMHSGPQYACLAHQHLTLAVHPRKHSNPSVRFPVSITLQTQITEREPLLLFDFVTLPSFRFAFYYVNFKNMLAIC